MFPYRNENQTQRRSATLYFQGTPKSKRKTLSLNGPISLTAVSDNEWLAVGEIDACELLKYNLGQVEKKIKFLSPWPMQNAYTLKHCLLTNYDYPSLQSGNFESAAEIATMTQTQRMKTMPAWVKEMLGQPVSPLVFTVQNTPSRKPS